MNEIESAIKVVNGITFCGGCTVSRLAKYENCKDCPCYKANQTVLEVLQAQAERDNPQPLTLEQLKERDGKPVYVVFGIHLHCPNDEHWLIAEIVPMPNNAFARFYGARSMYRSPGFDSYGKEWIAYDHEPKEQVK